MRRFAICWSRAVPGLLLGLLLGCLPPARADTPVSLYQSFRGNVNFVGTEETLRSKDNKKPCNLVNGGISAYLQGIPSGATIKSAQLYWAGSGTVADYSVTFDGVAVTAPAARRYLAKVSANNTAYTYFSGAADVTSQVSKKGNGYYTFSGLSVNNGSPWCAVQGVVGGFALAVVYSHPNEPFRMLNLYEGFQSFQNTSLNISLGNFNVPSPLPANVTGRVGHITWEGDATLSQGGEDLLFNGVEMTDALNPKGNQFNSASNVTGDATSYGIDFDIYTLKAPTIQPGQSSATTTYKSGPDLVLLSSEIVAMPYVANADLALAMTRTGDLTVGSSTSYTLSVTNGGVDDEMGPVTVVDTLPAGLKLVSAGGANWTCASAASGSQTIVTCTQPGPVKSGVKMTPLVIAVTPTAAANYTNTATVSGKTGDDNSANNTAKDTSTSIDYGSAAMIFTKEACASGAKIVSAPQDSGCHKFIGPVVAGDAAGGRIYITAVKTSQGAQVANPMSASDFAASIELKFGCLPNVSAARTPVAYAGTSFDCNSTGWKAVSARFLGGQPSAVLADTANTPIAPFLYLDVGRLSVSMRYKNSVMDTVNFISKPLDIRFVAITRSSDGYADQQGVTGANDIGFARAGEPFRMRICAVMADAMASCAPSFGSEGVDFSFELDTFAVNLKGTPKVPLVSALKQPDLDLDQVVRDSFVLDHGFTRGAGAQNNSFETEARYFEAGMLAITPRLVDYLDTGQVGGSGAAGSDPARLVAGTRVVGRFYPDHFTTGATANFDCLAAMNCPAATGEAVDGAVYSMQPFAFSIKAYGLPRPGSADPSYLSLYQNIVIDPARPRPLSVSAAKAPSMTLLPPGRFDADPAAQLQPPAAANDFPDLGGKATWRLGDPYSSAGRAVAPGAPTAVYLRASMKEFRGALGGGYTEDIVSSVTPAGAAGGTQYEIGVVVVAGRLLVPNVFGSDLLKLPVSLSAQYWTGAAWATNTADSASMVASAIRPVTGGCRKFFAQDLKSGPCKATPLAWTSPGAGPLQLSAGKSTLVLQAPPRGSVGSVDYTLDSAASPWLPSTQARATFGLYRSPLIYLREVY